MDIDLSELCITSKAEVSFDDQSDVGVLTKKATGKKVREKVKSIMGAYTAPSKS